MRYDPNLGKLVDLSREDMPEVLAWMRRIQKNNYDSEPQWAADLLQDGDFVRNTNDRRFYTSTKLFQEVSMLVIRTLLEQLPPLSNIP